MYLVLRRRRMICRVGSIRAVVRLIRILVLIAGAL